MHFARGKNYPHAPYCEGATERQRERQRERGGKEMFGIRVEKLSALGIVPDGHKPLPPFINSPWLLLLLSSPFCQSPLFFNACCTQHSSHFAGTMGPSAEKISTNWHILFVPLFFWQFHLSPSTSNPPIPVISKVNTPLNAGLTHFHCGWFCFQFSHHLSHPTTSEEKRKLLSRKQKKFPIRHATETFFPSCLVLKGQKHACKCQEETWGKTRHGSPSHFFCGSEMVIAVFLPFFLLGRAWERPQSAA